MRKAMLYLLVGALAFPLLILLMTLSAIGRGASFLGESLYKRIDAIREQAERVTL